MEDGRVQILCYRCRCKGEGIYTSRKPAWDAAPARQYVRSGALRRVRRTGFIGIIVFIAGTAVRTVPRMRLSEYEKKRLVVHITKK